MTLTLPFIIESLGTLAFAISGIRLAAAKEFDWFGAYVVGLITAIGGGTIRDLLLDQTAFWMLNSVYLIVTGLAMIVVILLRRYLVKLNNTFLSSTLLDWRCLWSWVYKRPLTLASPFGWRS